VYGVLVEQPEQKRPLRAQRRCEYIIKMDLQKLGWGTWTGLIWLRIGTGGGGALVNAVMNLRVPNNTAYFSATS